MKKTLLYVLALIILVVLLGVSLIFFGGAKEPVHAQTTGCPVTTDAKCLAGWAWSSNIGWISFSSANTGAGSGGAYDVSVVDASGNLGGYAWSPNVGWISFSPAVNSTCPLQTADDDDICQARFSTSTGLVKGWARAIVGCQTDNWDATNKKCLGTGAGNDNGVGTVTTTAVGPVVWTVNSNPSAGTDMPFGTALDTSSVYVVGNDLTGSPYTRMRIEKRNKSDGALVTAFGTNGVLTENPSTYYDTFMGGYYSSNYLYVVGTDDAGWNGSGAERHEMRIEKRNSTSGVLSWTQTYQPTGYDSAKSVTGDSSAIYVAGYCGTFGCIQKRDMSTGNVLWTYTTPTSGRYYDNIIISSAGNIEVRDAWATFADTLSTANGSLISSGSGGQSISNNVSTDSSGVYDAQGGSGQWVIKKNSIVTTTSDSNTGWDGWIHLSGLNHASPDQTGNGGEYERRI